MAQIAAKKCEFSCDEVAVLYCKGCDQFLCVECRQNLHDRVRKFKDHEVVDINKEGNRVRPNPVCETHENQFVYYCSKCECLTCVECMTSSHNEHKTEKIKNVADARRQKVNQIIEQLKTKVETVKKKLETIDTEHSIQIKSDCETYVKTVEETVDDLHTIINRHKIISITTASDFKDIENEDLGRKRVFFRSRHDETADRLLKFENLLQETHDSTFLTEWKAFQTDVKMNDEETDDPLVAPRRIESFNQKKLARSVIDEIDEKFQMRLKEQEQIVVRLTEGIDALRNELKEKQEQIDNLANEADTRTDYINQLKITYEDRIKELENKLKQFEEEKTAHNDTGSNICNTKYVRIRNRLIKNYTEGTGVDKDGKRNRNSTTGVIPKSGTWKLGATVTGENLEDCVICMDTPDDPRRLQCGHVFCHNCISQHFKISNYPVCPTCSIQGVVTGNQPPGTMKICRRYCSLSGYPECGRIEIEYIIEPGRQGPEHKDEGRRFDGIRRIGYLPDNKKGQLVAKMLRVAFDRKLVFTIDEKHGVVTWNDIHHKTNPNPYEQLGYPDDTYLDRVIDELSAKGVTKKDIELHTSIN